MNDDSEELARQLKDLGREDRYERLNSLPSETLVKLIAAKWRSVGDYAWSVLHCYRIDERPRIFHLICDGFDAGLFRTVDARVRALNFLVDNAARDERAKAVYRRFLEDRSADVASCAVPGSVWSLDEGAIPILQRRIESTSSPYIVAKFGEAIDAISRRDPRLMRGADRDPKRWGLDIE